MLWPETTVEQLERDVRLAGRRYGHAARSYDLNGMRKADRDLTAAQLRLDAVRSQQPERPAFTRSETPT